ncbi:TagB1 [Desulforapulum autotrophicum HRM2]|uniref:TagB1 n=1 Tax=Desulforapulum autotrophicum (strain ATCC 43914 / DSM 3382 / VKM B-1955 / HRM2) TaxID=177437 RepID=C0QBQ4_DESAH|nr:TagB1 [Desulforapulum autotrophicum HRM2]
MDLAAHGTDQFQVKKYLLYVSNLYAFAIVRPLQAEILKQKGIVAWFLADKKFGSWLKKEEQLLETVAAVMAFEPDVVFVASNVVPDFFPGIKVQLFHGFNAQKRDASQGHFNIRGFFDLYCTQGPSTTVPFKALEKKYGHFKVVETGWTKVDPLFDEGDEYLSSRLAPDPRPVVLFTSTFTPALSAAHRVYDTIAAMMHQKKWRWIITLHPKMDRAVTLKFKQLCHACQSQFYGGDNVIPLLKQADVMLSDTSSIISEFILQKKPVVTFCNRMPGDHLINVTFDEDIEQAIEHALTRPASLMSAIDRYIADLHPYDDGRSSARVLAAVDDFLKNEKGKLRRKPLNLVRRIKMRLKYRYYRY